MSKLIELTSCEHNQCDQTCLYCIVGDEAKRIEKLDCNHVEIFFDDDSSAVLHQDGVSQEWHFLEPRPYDSILDGRFA